MKVATKTTMIGVLLISTLGLTGCATVFSPSQQPIALKSDNPNTSYYQNNKYVGHGKSASFELMRDHTTTITAKAPGCKPVTITTKQRFNKLALMNIFNGFVGFIVDGVTGAIRTPMKTNYTLNPICNDQRRTQT